MACRQLKIWWLFVSLSLFCQSAEALAPTRPSKIATEPQRAQRKMNDLRNQRSQSEDDETAFSRRNLFRQAGIASASIFLSSIGFSNPLPAQAADDLDFYLVSWFSDILFLDCRLGSWSKMDFSDTRTLLYTIFQNNNSVQNHPSSRGYAAGATVDQIWKIQGHATSECQVSHQIHGAKL